MKKHLLLLAAAAAVLPAAASSPFISRVFAFQPAPGQFLNEIPETDETTTLASVLALAEEQLCGGENPGMVSLGAFGGYIVFGFDHPLLNVAGDYDLMIYGNALRDASDTGAGSPEPGIVSVSVDANGNGLPDDPWYELAGSEYAAPSTLHAMGITYFKPDATHTPVPDPSNRYITDTEYIRWTSTDPARPQGWLQQNSFHSQSYWPSWLDDTAELSFTGTCVAEQRGTDSTDSHVKLKPLAWGYVDNLPNADCPGFKLDWAVDAAGNPVELTHADFVRVHTAVCATNGWLGEISTEITGARDLHPEASAPRVDASASAPCRFYDMQGTQLREAPRSGIYIAVYPDGTAAARLSAR